MNYSKVLTNPLYDRSKFRVSSHPKSEALNTLRLHHLYQNPLPTNYPVIKRPFSMSNRQNGKISMNTLTTTSSVQRQQIFERNFPKTAYDLQLIQPVGCMLGSNAETNWDLEIEKVGNVKFRPVYETEEERHLKAQPPGVITQFSLVEILNPRLKKLNLINHTWIPREQILKLGYMASNISEIGLAGLSAVDDQVLSEIVFTLKHLQKIDISHCPNITEQGVEHLLVQKPNLTEFSAAHNDKAVTDASTASLERNSQLEIINVSFCKQLTDKFINYLLNSKCKLIYLNLTTIDNISDNQLFELISQNTKSLSSLDLAFTNANNSLLGKLSTCPNLSLINLTGCQKVSGDGFRKMFFGMPPEGLPKLNIFKLNGLKDISDDEIGKLFSQMPNLQTLELNGMELLTDAILTDIQNHLKLLVKLNINLCPLITQQAIEYAMQVNPHLQICRNILKMSDPTDDGLRMPFLTVKQYERNKKKKKKKKKK